MINLDSPSDILKLDREKILESIRGLPYQFTDTWEAFDNIKLGEGVRACQNVVICGMGGSALGGRIVDSLTYGRARVPIEIFTEYKIPNYVNANTFVIVSSYSGDTEETLYATHEALEKKAKIFGITSGGKLIDFLKDNSIPYLQINPKFNPSGQPRMGLGYSLAAILRILSMNAFIRFGNEENLIKEAIKSFIKEYDIDIPEKENLAKATAQGLLGKIPILFASEHLLGSAHAFANQLNENSKTFSAHFDIPEANHHLLEGLKFPKNAMDLLMFLHIESKLYTPQVLKRYQVTREVVERAGYKSMIYITRSESKYEEIFEVLVFGSFVSFYLAALEGIDPGPIPTVDFFKEKLAK